MVKCLLGYVVSDLTDEDVAEIARVVRGLVESSSWNVGPPQFVNELDSASCTQPEDEPIRTIGAVLPVSVGDGPSASAMELRRFVGALAKVSGARGLEFEFELNGTYVGDVQGGEPDRLLEEGLLARW